jgi:hypothetical protein
MQNEFNATHLVKASGIRLSILHRLPDCVVIRLTSMTISGRNFERVDCLLFQFGKSYGVRTISKA